MGEYARFKRRLKGDTDGSLLFIPVQGDLSPECKLQSPTMQEIFQTYQLVKLYPRITDGMTALQITIDIAMRKKKTGLNLR